MNAKDRILVALDVETPGKALDLVELLGPFVGGFKIGLQLFCSMLVSLVIADEAQATHELKQIRKLFSLLAGRLFLDLKFHDIPNTVAGASNAVAKLNPMLFNVHASGGKEAMKSAAENKGESLLLGVTLLTSLNATDVVELYGSTTEAKVLHFADISKRSGADGIVCSSYELKALGKQVACAGLIKIVPGIRSKDSPPDDQKRTVTVSEAIRAGADYLVIGRPITQASDPVIAAKQFATEIEEALSTEEIS